MKIILSTYNYYPTHVGGTEVYTKGLANFLSKQGHEVVIVAASEAPCDMKSELLLEDGSATAIRYTYEGLTVLGISLKDQSIDALYAFEKEEWTSFFRKLLSLTGFSDAGLLLMNGLSGVSGLSLAEAFRQGNAAGKVAVIVHTPFFCIKSDLLFANSNKKCGEKVSPLTCASCMIASRSRMNYQLVRVGFPVIKRVGKLTGNELLANMDRLLVKTLEDLERMGALSDAWIVFSNDMAGFLTKQSFPGSAKLKIIRHGIDTSVFNNKERSLPAETVFVYAGRFEKIKGVLLLADAWLRTADDKKTKRLLLAGAWNKSSCGNQVHEKLSGREDVLFLDNLDQASLASLYKKTHCVIVPSQWIETGPLVIHEAVASGCDVITSDIGGQNELADIYAARVTKFKNGDVVSLANAINHYRAGTTDISGQVIDEAMHYRQVADLFML